VLMAWIRSRKADTELAPTVLETVAANGSAVSLTWTDVHLLLTIGFRSAR